MANGYDSISLKATGLNEAASSGDTTMSKMMPVAVRDKRFTKKGSFRSTQKEAATARDYPGGEATRKRGTGDRQRPWETAQEATRPQIKPRETLERSGLLEALPPWLKKKGEGDDEEQKEAAVQFVKENMSDFPCEGDARMALAVLSQFVDGDTLDDLQQAIEDQYGDPMEAPPVPEGDWDDDSMPLGLMGESALTEAPLTADKRNNLDSSDFALPGRRYPIDTPARARAALARVKQFGKEGEEAKVKAAVKKKYPNMDVE
ncbi:hypothetical protein SEA_SATIS_229 [Streptomyces phage Satis]|nr:hypothetical protein SEA_SATIS_229 [Streptomyces phage Satis]QBZ72116.1 hypothetical protein SEA_KRADAL_230 [Streptomyces phage Kradal]QPL14537.1 hypothetical protein SEA_EHYELIMAYOE_232 [Streptomyces phage EhyElimayoE]